MIIEENLDYNYQDIPPWRSYEFYTEGETFDELIENVTIAEIDQDGGELNCYGFEDANNKIQDEIELIIKMRLKNGS